MNSPTQQVGIETNPPGAICSVGRFRITTPGVVALKRDSGTQEILCTLSGYEMASAVFMSEWDGVEYSVGDLLTGLIPGLLVDGYTGAANHFSPDIIRLKMKPVEIPTTLPGYR